jgi:hypothetical protein
MWGFGEEMEFSDMLSEKLAEFELKAARKMSTD